MTVQQVEQRLKDSNSLQDYPRSRSPQVMSQEENFSLHCVKDDQIEGRKNTLQNVFNIYLNYVIEGI